MCPADGAVVECVKVLSVDGNIIHINPAGLDLLEVNSDHSLDGRCYVDIWPQDNRARVSRAIADARQGAGSTLEGYCPTFLGTPRWWQTSFYADKIDAGMRTVVIGVSRDISPQRGDLLAHRAARERFSLLAETSRDGVIAVAPNGLCTYCNAAGALLLGYAPYELIGRPLDAIIHRRGVGRQAEFPAESPIVRATHSTAPSQFEYERITHRNGLGISVSCVVYPCTPASEWCACVLTFAATPAPHEGSPRLLAATAKPALLVEMEAALLVIENKPR